MVNELEKQNILKKVDEELNEIADFIFSKSQENIVEYGAIDEATLLKSGYVNRQFLEKEIGYSAPYAGHVDFGTDPHMPPVAPLIAWVKRKFLFQINKQQELLGLLLKQLKEMVLSQDLFLEMHYSKVK